MTDATNPLLTQPTRLGSLMYVVQTLLTYGRHLADTVVQRARQPSFASIAVCFGTADLPLIMARLERGILRALALARVLHARCQTGRDVTCTTPSFCTRKAVDTPKPTPATQRKPRAARTSTPSRWDDLTSPMTLEEIEAAVRRRPIGRTILDICHDLGVQPGLCERAFGSELFDAIAYHRGRINKWMAEKSRRWHAFLKERDRGPVKPWWDWMDDDHDRNRAVLGFAIGEPPTLPPDLLPNPT